MRTANVVLIGPPGSGKGTQATRISTRYGLPFISTGDMLRAAVKAGSDLGRKVRSVMDSGGLVGDDLMIALVRERLSAPDTATGFILDGFPRTAAQACALDKMPAVQPLVAIVLDVPQDELERRLDSRRICSTCKTLYTAGSRYGSEEELCSRCGSVLIKRDDDNLATIKTRLQTYTRTAEPLIEHYRAQGGLALIDGRRPPDLVAKDIQARLDQHLAR